MIELSSDESRVLGVLIEKDRTTPEQYPMSLNAVTNGCNQKNNRDPILSMEEPAVFQALESLRHKNLVIRSDAPGQRVDKFRHNAADVLRLRAGEVAIIAELLLRGPQTLGELRGRAARMHPMESLDIAKDLVRMLMEREEPYVKMIPAAPGSRAERYVQLLCPDLHPLDSVGTADVPAAPGSPTLAQRVEALEAEVAQLRLELRRLQPPQD